MISSLLKITDSTPFELLEYGRARFYVDHGWVESVFDSFYVICSTRDILYMHYSDNLNWKKEALDIMLARVDIKEVDLVKGKFGNSNRIASDLPSDVLILKFKNEADEAFFKFSFVNGFHETAEYPEITVEEGI